MGIPMNVHDYYMHHSQANEPYGSFAQPYNTVCAGHTLSHAIV